MTLPPLLLFRRACKRRKKRAALLGFVLSVLGPGISCHILRFAAPRKVQTQKRGYHRPAAGCLASICPYVWLDVLRPWLLAGVADRLRTWVSLLVCGGLLYNVLFLAREAFLGLSFHLYRRRGAL